MHQVVDKPMENANLTIARVGERYAIWLRIFAICCRFSSFLQLACGSVSSSYRRVSRRSGQTCYESPFAMHKVLTSTLRRVSRGRGRRMAARSSATMSGPASFLRQAEAVTRGQCEGRRRIESEVQMCDSGEGCKSFTGLSGPKGHTDTIEALRRVTGGLGSKTPEAEGPVTATYPTKHGPEGVWCTRSEFVVRQCVASLCG